MISYLTRNKGASSFDRLQRMRDPLASGDTLRQADTKKVTQRRPNMRPHAVWLGVYESDASHMLFLMIGLPDAT